MSRRGAVGAGGAGGGRGAMSRRGGGGASGGGADGRGGSPSDAVGAVDAGSTGGAGRRRGGAGRRRGGVGGGRGGNADGDDRAGGGGAGNDGGEGDGQALVLERFLPYRLSLLANTVSRSLAGIYAHRHRLSIAEWRVMAVLGDEPESAPATTPATTPAPITAAAICVRTAMDKVRVSRAVRGLTAKGHLVRRTDPDDRRRILLHLSAGGLAVYREIVPRARAAEAELLNALSPAEAAQLDALLTKRQAEAEVRGKKLAEPASDI